MDVEARAKAVLADALGVGETEISTETALFVTAEWTSLAHLRLVLALEEATGQTLDPATIVELTDYADVAKILSVT